MLVLLRRLDVLSTSLNSPDSTQQGKSPPRLGLLLKLLQVFMNQLQRMRILLDHQSRR